MKPLFYIREHSVEKALRKACEAKDWLCKKFIPCAWRGVPDRIVFKGIEGAIQHYMAWNWCTHEKAEREVRNILALVLTFAELKSPDGGEPEEHQLRRHAELRALGFEVVVLNSQEAAEVWVDNA